MSFFIEKKIYLMQTYFFGIPVSGQWICTEWKIKWFNIFMTLLISGITAYCYFSK